MSGFAVRWEVNDVNLFDVRRGYHATDISILYTPVTSCYYSARGTGTDMFHHLGRGRSEGRMINTLKCSLRVGSHLYGLTNFSFYLLPPDLLLAFWAYAR